MPSASRLVAAVAAITVALALNPASATALGGAEALAAAAEGATFGASGGNDAVDLAGATGVGLVLPATASDGASWADVAASVLEPAAILPIGLQGNNSTRPQCDFEAGAPGLPNCGNASQRIADESDGPTPEEAELAILQALQSLPVAPSPINYQPDGTWAAVNMDFIVYTDRNEQVLGTTIFDIPVTFTLTPVHWTWDFGDGSTPLQTSSVGAPYPNQTVSHVYTTASDGVTVSVTTLWSGTFTIADDPTPYPVNGFVTTTNSAGPVEIVAFKIVLVPNPGES